MSKNTGGPAFPLIFGQGNETAMQIGSEGGMTLRDYFAAKAIPKAFEDYGKRPSFTGEYRLTAADCARTAYGIADAMLAEREKQA